jgi:hypothetical protein
VTATIPGEPTLADVKARFPQWQSTGGISGLYHACHEATGQRVTGEDPLDLADQIKAADAFGRCAGWRSGCSSCSSPACWPGAPPKRRRNQPLSQPERVPPASAKSGPRISAA